MGTDLLPLSVVVPTRDRHAMLRRTLESIAAQSDQPEEIIIIDASARPDARALCLEPPIPFLCGRISWLPALSAGAASQRNQGVSACRHPVIGFFDDDILLEPNCMVRLWNALHSDATLGGVNAMIVNQRYQAPGPISLTLFRALAGREEEFGAGKIFGPAINLLPEDRDDLPEVVPVQWLNTTCTLYRREALPEPPFTRHFTGYSLMEDVALSLIVGRRWRLANARTARIYHDSQPGAHKDDIVALGRMELVNRHHVMADVLQRRRIRDYAKLAMWECFQLATCAIQKRGGIAFWRLLHGKILGARDVLGASSRLERRS